jgi:hypothetical protein
VRRFFSLGANIASFLGHCLLQEEYNLPHHNLARLFALPKYKEKTRGTIQICLKKKNYRLIFHFYSHPSENCFFYFSLIIRFTLARQLLPKHFTPSLIHPLSIFLIPSPLKPLPFSEHLNPLITFPYTPSSFYQFSRTRFSCSDLQFFITFPTLL